MVSPLVSICIPSYNQPQLLSRCLESILIQDYSNIEVVVSDDSPGEDIEGVIEPFRKNLKVNFVRNRPPKKSPGNWNNALLLGNGRYKMLMHQDDWLNVPQAISVFVKALEDSHADFAFCQNTAVDENGKKLILQARPQLLKKLSEKPDHLLLSQIIGPPSNVMIRSEVDVRYDERLIWLVDVDYFNRILKAGYKYDYLPLNLVNIGLHEAQTTVFCRNHPDVIVRENMLVAEKIGDKAFNDVVLFDYYWRFLRNYDLRAEQDFRNNGIELKAVAPVIQTMQSFQQHFPSGVLRFGPSSKALMGLCYLKWKLSHSSDGKT